MAALPSLHQALYKYLSGYAPLVALVGTRCYPGIAPSKAAFPYVTVQRIAVDSIYHHGGPSATADTMMQIDCWSTDAMQAQQVAQTIRNSLDGASALWDGLAIDGVFVANELDDAEPAEDGSERLYYRTILTLDCWHERTVPAL